MFEATIQSLEEDHGLLGVEYVRVALNEHDVEFLGAAHDFEPIKVKAGDSRAAGFVERYGPHGYELDAIHPRTLQDMARQSIKGYLDMALFEEQRQVEAAERAELARLKDRLFSDFKCLTSQTGESGP
ncbi:MAG: hypothetical protein KJ621_08510 [Proteobacteria bacterium]|nr:hypothetical protein [Pseudomonadota bacterium]